MGIRSRGYVYSTLFHAKEGNRMYNLANQVMRPVRVYYKISCDARPVEIFVDEEFEAASAYFNLCEEMGLYPKWEESYPS